MNHSLERFFFKGVLKSFLLRILKQNLSRVNIEREILFKIDY